MTKYKLVVALFCLLLGSCKHKPKAELVNQMQQSDVASLEQEVLQLEQLVQSNARQKQLQDQFFMARLAYKKVEALTEYYFPGIARFINGAAISEYKSDEGITLPAAGFLPIEAYLFPVYAAQSKKPLLKEIGILKASLLRLHRISASNILTDSSIFDAMRLEVFRIITLGISGFDSPIAQSSMMEAKAALETVEKQLVLYNQTKSQSIALELLKEGRTYLENHKAFNEFDRAFFIKSYMNPLSKALYNCQMELKIPFPVQERGLRLSAQSLFDRNAFDADAFVAFSEDQSSREKTELGKLLFRDPVLSKNNSRSCSSCHQDNKAFTDGLEVPMALDGKRRLKRNTPTLSYIAFQHGFFYDSSVSYLEDQASKVIENVDEMHGSFEVIVSKLTKDKKYVQRFSKAYPSQEISSYTIRNALASYIRSLGTFDSKFDGYFRGENKLTPDEIAGFNLFSGKAKCASCHFIPLTSGTVPPTFDKSESEVLGVPSKYKKMDADLGKYNLTGAALHRFSFKTPNIRNIALTAPYMHNGVFSSLEEVVDFYDKGGGAGLGFQLDNQTLPADRLNLTAAEKKQLIAFMKCLTDKNKIPYQ